MYHLLKAFFVDFAYYARHIDPTAFWFLIILFSFLALGGVWTFYYYLQNRVIQTAKVVSIADSNPGYVELHGHAKSIDGQLLKSPLTHTPCVWFRYKVWEYCPGRAGFELIDYKGGMFRLLVVQDETDQCAINVAGAKMRPNESALYYSDELNADLSQMTKHYQQQKYCFEEEYITPDSTLWVAGNFRHMDKEYEMNVNMNPERAVSRIQDATGEEWVDEMMEQRWFNEPLAAGDQLQKQWQAYCANFPDELRPAIMSDIDLRMDQVYALTTSQKFEPSKHNPWLFVLSGIFSVAVLVVIASMLWLRLS